jgi:purine-binding chemotaxis protein CheW
VIVEVDQETDSQVIGVLVDSVSEVLEIAQDSLRGAPSFGASIRTDFIRAMGKLGEAFVIILDENKVLSVEEMTLVGQVRDAAMEN